MKNTGNNRIKQGVYICLSIGLICFFVMGLTITNSAKETLSILISLYKHGYVMIYVWVYLALMIIVSMISRKVDLYCKEKVLLFLFLASFLPRMLLVTQRNYIPISDFNSYLEMGVHFAEGDKTFVNSLISHYQIPKFGGLAVFMGVIARIFSEKLIGFQIANIVLTSFICIFIYLCMEKYSRRNAFSASLLFSFYPANIVSSQITTNHHGAILFSLVGIYMLIELEHKDNLRKAIYAIIGGVSFAVSDFFHPSVIVPIIAVICYGIMGCFGKSKFDFTRIKFSLYCVLGYVVTLNVGIFVLTTTGVISEEINDSASSYLPKIVVGFNEETRGCYSEEDYYIAKNLPDNEQQQWCMQQIKERVFNSSFKDICNLLNDKIDCVWFGQDSHFYWYVGGWQAKVEEDLLNGKITDEEYKMQYNQLEIYFSYALFDWLFLKAIYILVVIGLIVSLKDQNICFELSRWMLLGWIAIHLLIEVQPRYRYLGMPYIFLFAGSGVGWVSHKYNDIQPLIKNMLRNGNERGM